MEIIKSLKRKENRRGSLSKLKIDITKSPLKNVEKIVNYMAKDLKDIDLDNTDPAEYMQFEHFKLDIGRVLNASFIKRVTSKFTKEDAKLYEFFVYDDDGKYVSAYSIPSIKIPDKTRMYHYKIPTPSDRTKILDTKFLYGFLKTLDMVFEEICERKSFYFSEEFEKLSIFKQKYSDDVMGYIIDIFYNSKGSLYCLNKDDLQLHQETLMLIIDVITIIKNVDLNIELSEKHENNTNSECSRAFETKKNIPYKILSVMNSNRFLQDFSYVEIDEETEISKFRKLEIEWEKVKVALKLDKYLKNVKPELRFKKLGKHRALGLYYPTLKCICIDIISPSSFIHEFGHFIDYTSKKGQLSLQMDFYPIILEYKVAYNKFMQDNPESDSLSYLRKKSEYFFAPTEIFARGLEIYLANKGVKSSFITDKEDFTIRGGYPEVSEEFLKKINEYYDEIIKVNLKALNDDYKVRSKKATSKYLEPVISSTGQLTFNII